jgi:hypothetical protein
LYYDIWSNIHFGYAGSAAGFEEGVLLDGAGLEQIGTDLLRRRWPTRSQGVQGLRAYDDKSDRASISMTSPRPSASAEKKWMSTHPLAIG